MSPRSRGDQILTDFNDIPGSQVEQDEDEDERVKDGLQTFVFSATLSKDLQRNLKKRFQPKGNKKHYKRGPSQASTLGMRAVLQYHP
jgi:ATP-dependent RNA helicase DDX24/MAK5